MHQPDYRFVFADMMDRFASVQIIRPGDQQKHVAQVEVDLAQLMRRAQRPLPSLVADLIDLALAVYVADRLTVRRADTAVTITVSLPVRHEELLGNSSSTQLLQDILYWFTGDRWEFEFIRRVKIGRSVENQMSLSLLSVDEPVEVSLWSGGLDSLAGLYTRLIDEPDLRHVLFGSGSNSIMNGAQQRASAAVADLVPDRTVLIQAPIRTGDTRTLGKSSSQRSRGFVFMLLGAASALMEGQHVLNIYENGIGAINLPFRTSEVGLDHSRAVHPLSLIKMGQLVSHLLGASFSFRNQFLLTTKAQMCTPLAELPARDLIFSTITCDSLHRKKGLQCGCCSSCLLRRQALAVPGIPDMTPYVSLHGRSRTQEERQQDSLHFRAMLHQVATFRKLLGADDPWFAFVHEYSTLGDIVDLTAIYAPLEKNMADGLLRLYRRYVDEWDTVQYLIGRDVLEDVDMCTAA